MDVKDATSSSRFFFVHQDLNIRQQIGRHAQLEAARKKRSEKYEKAQAEKKKSIVASGPLPWRMRQERSQVFYYPSRSLSRPDSIPGYGDSLFKNTREVYHAANEDSNPLARELSVNSGDAKEGSQALESSPTREFPNILSKTWPNIPSHPQTFLSAGRVDAFRAYPIEFSSPAIDALVDHCKCFSSFLIQTVTRNSRFYTRSVNVWLSSKYRIRYPQRRFICSGNYKSIVLPYYSFRRSNAYGRRPRS